MNTFGQHVEPAKKKEKRKKKAKHNLVAIPSSTQLAPSITGSFGVFIFTLYRK